MFWSARPFVRIFLLLAIGILIAFKIDSLREVSVFVYYGIISFLLLAAVWMLPKRFSYTLHRVKGLVLSASIITVGILIVTFHLPRYAGSSHTIQGTFSGIIVTQPVETDKALKAVVKTSKRYDSIISPFSRKVLLYFEKEDSMGNLHYGDVVLFSTILKVPDTPANPEEFNYRLFLKAKGIELVGFVSSSNYQIERHNPPWKIIDFAISLRQKILTALQKNGLSGDQYAVAAAIVLGYDDVMQDHIRQNYQRAGAMHVLCVSGLHVGVIYLVMAMLLKFLNKKRWQKILKVIILLLTIWFYALLTGMSPSVMRAAVMISFLIVGNEVERDKDAYNTLAMSAVLLLIINPGFLFDVGFQLSYAAVLGIVTFYWFVYRWFYVKNRLLNKLWAATAISIAAQLGAFPIAAHYFHFFPTWFLLSNLVVMIFSSFVISIGMLFIMVSWVPVVSAWVAFLLSGLIYLMNFLISFIGDLPVSGVGDLFFPWEKVAVVYAIIFLGFLFVSRREKQFVIPALSAMLLFVLIQTYHEFKILKQNRMVVYNVGKKYHAIDFIHGKNHLLLYSGDSKTGTKHFDYYVDNFRVKWGLKKNRVSFDSLPVENEIGLWKDNNFLQYNGVRIVRVGNNDFYPVQSPITVDWMWVTGNGNIEVDKLMKVYKFNKVILGCSVFATYSKNLKAKFKKLKIPVYDIGQEGALVWPLQK